MRHEFGSVAGDYGVTRTLNPSAGGAWLDGERRPR